MACANHLLTNFKSNIEQTLNFEDLSQFKSVLEVCLGKRRKPGRLQCTKGTATVKVTCISLVCFVRLRNLGPNHEIEWNCDACAFA